MEKNATYFKKRLTTTKENSNIKNLKFDKS